LIAPLALYYGAGLPAHWGNILLGVVFYLAAGVCFTLALFRLDVSVLTPFFSVRTAFAVLLGVGVLHEVLHGYQYALIAVILVCGVVVSLDERLSIKSFFSKGVLFAFLLMLSLPLEGLFIKRAIAETGYWETALWMSVVGQSALLLTAPLFAKELPRVRPKQYGAALLISAAGVVGTLGANKAYAENVGITSAILSLPLSLIFVIIFSIFKSDLLEKHNRKVYAIRFAAAAVMILAALKLG